jgi:hypothetical protein
VCNNTLQPSVVILLTTAKGITMTGCAALLHMNFFVMPIKAQAKLQPQLTGVTLLVRSSPKITGLAHRSWTSPSRGYCWGRAFSSAWRTPAVTPGSQVFQICNTLAYAKGVFTMFCRESKVYEVSKQRLWWTGETEARETTRAKVKSRRGHAAYQPEVAALAWHVAAPHWSVKRDVIM